MDAMRADMGGAATVCSAIVTAAALKLPVNIVGGQSLFSLKQRFNDYTVCVWKKVTHTVKCVHCIYCSTLLGLAPLCENMPSGKANKPGDVVKAKNGKTIQVL